MRHLLIASAFLAALPICIAQASGEQAVIATSLGDITIALDTDRAPKTVANFWRYAEEGHYNGTVFYRVVPGALVQAGSYDADGKPRGGIHAPIAYEGNNGLKNVRGAVAMARLDDPHSATAEFFIDIAALPSLDDTPDAKGYTVFGQVVSGMDVVDKIAALPLGGVGPFEGAAPLTPVLIKSVVVKDAPPLPPVSNELPPGTH